DNQIVQAAGAVSLTATDNTTVTAEALAAAISGNVSLAGGSVAIGVAQATNDASTTARAAIENSKVVSTTGAVSVTPHATGPPTAPPEGTAAGSAAPRAGFSGPGAGAVARNPPPRTVDPHISGGSVATAATTVTVDAKDPSPASASLTAVSV